MDMIGNVRRIKLRDQFSDGEICGRTGLARNTVKKWLKGTTAFGAALHTANGAAQNGYKVVLPVDCVTGGSLFEEQATVWSLFNGPGTGRVLTATTLDAIKIE